jgi:hypothetical protein
MQWLLRRVVVVVDMCVDIEASKKHRRRVAMQREEE